MFVIRFYSQSAAPTKRSRKSKKRWVFTRFTCFFLTRYLVKSSTRHTYIATVNAGICDASPVDIQTRRDEARDTIKSNDPTPVCVMRLKMRR